MGRTGPVQVPVEEYDEYRTARGQPEPDGRQFVYLDPVSPVANEIWVYWETGRMLMRFQSDMDLAHPGVLKHNELAVDIFDIDEQIEFERRRVHDVCRLEASVQVSVHCVRVLGDDGDTLHTSSKATNRTE